MSDTTTPMTVSTRIVRPSLAALRLAYLAGSLRQGLPGDGRPIDATEARRRCPHAIVRHRIYTDPLLPAPVVRSWTEPVDAHTCIGGWLL
jgi:hypothetical protein